MHGVSYPALMLIVDGLPEAKSKEKKKTHRDPNIALAQAGIKLMEG